MPGITVTKRVVFIGAWRTHTVNDQLLRQINSQAAAKKGVYTLLTLTSNGLELNILDSKGNVNRRDSIPLENIVDLIDNKYNTRCTLAIVRNKQLNQYTVYVFICDSEKDTAAIINTFKGAKGQLIGEGYNVGLTPTGKNWTLIPKQDESEDESDKDRAAVMSNANHVEVNHIQLSNAKESVTFQAANTVMDVNGRAVRASSPPPRENVMQGPIYVKRALSPSRRVYPARPAEIQYQAAPARAPTGQGPAFRTVYAMPVSGQYVRGSSVSSRGSNAYNRNVSDSTRFQAVQSPHVYFQQQPQLHPQPQLHLQPAPTKRTKGFFRKTKKEKKKKENNSYGRDTVTKSIEEVYRGRSRRRMVLPPPHANWNTVQYVALPNGGLSPVKMENGNPFSERHVHVRDTYIPHERSDPRVEDHIYDIVHTGEGEQRTGYEHVSNDTKHQDEYVVQTTFKESYQPDKTKDGKYGDERAQKQVITSEVITRVHTEQTNDQGQVVHVVKITENGVGKDDHVDDPIEKKGYDDGLFESYVPTPELEEDHVIKRENAVRYHEDSESESEISENERNDHKHDKSLSTADSKENEDKTNDGVKIVTASIYQMTAVGRTDEMNNAEVNSADAVEVNDINIVEINTADAIEVNDTNVVEINTADDIEVNDTDAVEINIANDIEVNDTDVVEINNADDVEVNYTDVVKINNTDDIKVNDTDVVEIKNVYVDDVYDAETIDDKIADFDKTEDVQEEPYRLDLDALNAYSQIPDVFLVHSVRHDDDDTALTSRRFENEQPEEDIENENQLFSASKENEINPRSKSSKDIHVSFREDEITNKIHSTEENLFQRNDISLVEDTAVVEPELNEDSEEEEPYELDVNALNAYSEIPDVVIVKSAENHSIRDTELYDFDSRVDDIDQNTEENDEHPVKKEVDIYYDKDHDEIMKTTESTVLF